MNFTQKISTAALALALFHNAPASSVTRVPVTADHAMVVTSQHLATDVGVEIMKQGGNAVDAAVAVGYALAVTNPCCGNIGGGGFATLHMADGKDVFVNFREKAPGASTEKMYLNAAGDVVPDLSLKGYLAVGVPGSVLGLDTLLQKYGTMKREAVMAPAIKLAQEGFVLNDGDVAHGRLGKGLCRSAQCGNNFSARWKALGGWRSVHPEKLGQHLKANLCKGP